MVAPRVHTLRGNVFRRIFLVTFREEIIPVSSKDVAYFAVDEVSVVLGTTQGKKFRIHESLQHVEESVDPARFFRANRQYLIAYDAVRRIEQLPSRKLLVELSIGDITKIPVSRARANDFLKWMEVGTCEDSFRL